MGKSWNVKIAEEEEEITLPDNEWLFGSLASFGTRNRVIIVYYVLPTTEDVLSWVGGAFE